MGHDGKADEAIATLRAVVAAAPAFLDGFLLLGSLLEGQGRAGEAVKIYRAALRIDGLSPEVRHELERKIHSPRPLGEGQGVRATGRRDQFRRARDFNQPSP